MKRMTTFLMLLLMVGILAACNSAPTESDASSKADAPKESRLAPLWGDNLGGRDVYTNADVEAGVLGDLVTLNSVIDSPIRDARFFIWAHAVGSGEPEDPTANVVQVEDGKIYEIWMYVQNDNSGTTAEGVRAAISVPTMSTGKACQIAGFVHSDNAVATKAWSTVTLTGEQGFALNYVFGETKLFNAAHPDGLSLSDGIVTKAASERGVLIGYDELDGKLPGGSDYGTYIMIQVQAQYLEPVPMSVKSRARMDETAEWQEVLAGVQAGDELTYRVEYQNVSTGTEEKVLGAFELDPNLEYIAGSARFFNAEFPDGVNLKDDFVSNGVGIGDYGANANAIIEFRVRVAENLPEDGATIRSEFSCQDTTEQSLVRIVN